MRCALLGPIPGSRPSSSIRSWTGPSYIAGRSVHARQPEAGKAATERTHPCGLQVGGLTRRVVDCGDNEVFERLDVVAVDDAGVDAHRHHLTGPGHHCGHEPA